MRIADLLSRYFSANVHKHGEHYYRGGRVHIDEASESTICAIVFGSQAYDVSLNFRAGTLSIACGCAYFGDTSTPCKHIWAVILAADAQGYLRQLQSAATVILDTGDDDFDDGFDESRDLPAVTAPRIAQPPVAVGKRSTPKQVSWHQLLSQFLDNPAQQSRSNARWPAKREILYVVDVADSSGEKQVLSLSLLCHEPKTNGSGGAPRPLSVSRSDISSVENPADREILSALAGGDRYVFDAYEQLPSSFFLRPTLAGLAMPLIGRTGRCFWRRDHFSDLIPLTWDPGGIWNFELEIRRENGGLVLSGCFRRGEESVDLSIPVLVTPGLVFTAQHIAPIADESGWEWLVALRNRRSLTISNKDQDEFLAALLASPNLPPLIVPEELHWEEVTPAAQPRLMIFKPRDQDRQARLRAELSFAYEDRVVSHNDPARGFYDAANRRYLRRDAEAEKTAIGLLDQLGVKSRRATYMEPEPARDMAPGKLPMIVRSLLGAGWHVEAEQKIFRRPGSFQMEVATGIDWFELHGKVEYGDASAQLPELLDALRRGEQMVQLSDGTYGMLPEEWLGQFGPVAAMGTLEDGHIRFRRSQAPLLDALLAAQSEVHCDDSFVALRRELRAFDGVNPSGQPAGFVGTLRDYQREGLGWIQFLQRFSFGGCLADDMGVGKTAQVLALLETRRELRAAGELHVPSLAVVPKSLVFNWKQEAAHFTPRLRILDHTGTTRHGNDFSSYDVVLTTYGILRRDILQFKDFDFDYIVLDEAQAIKNANAQLSKAVRLLHGRYRLALSGTPVENHLGELWSLFEFLNPGMLGSASLFKLAGGAMRNPSEETRRLLAQALRPFILRRTKEQVARELPPKTEQTLYCEMEAAERRRYEDLRRHYQQSLLQRIETEGLAKSKIQVLEALLRLRQAACHPGLLSAERTAEPSAKLELLLEQLVEVLEAGHKALVFSQFTSFLKIVRNRLDSLGITYEYLDGSTRDRQERVERFQTDRDCGAFLISLKAGGLGLNLTSAEYIFILDPWWNPAVEAQAIDRAHRIGQTLPVFAYRLITRETVEEKVLQLQSIKRDLAASIITGDNSLIRNLQPADLALLLS
jgi:superfamily II DNA or RNA helicase